MKKSFRWMFHDWVAVRIKNARARLDKGASKLVLVGTAMFLAFLVPFIIFFPEPEGWIKAKRERLKKEAVDEAIKEAEDLMKG